MDPYSSSFVNLSMASEVFVSVDNRVLVQQAPTSISNFVNDSSTMKDKPSINDLCSDPHNSNSSMCNKGALGLSVSTPVLMMSFGILGNIIALIVLYTATKEVRRTVFYTLLAGLAWTDLTGQILVSPIAVIMYANNLEWVGGEPLCKYHAFMMVAFGMITPLLVCTMALERLLALRFTYFYARVVTRRKAQITIIICWIFVLVYCSLPLIGFGSFEHQFPGSWCFLNFHRESTMDIVYAYIYAIFNILVIVVIVVFNAAVIFTLIKMKKVRKINNSPSIERRESVKPKSKLKVETETQMVWFLCAITIVFCTCWMPLNINILINQITGQISYPTDLIGVRMAGINQILDPWLYILLRKAIIMKGFRFIKYFITDKRKYQSPTRSNQKNKIISKRGMITRELHELRPYDPKMKISIVTEPIPEENHSDDSSTCSTVKLIYSEAETGPELVKRSRYMRSLSADHAAERRPRLMRNMSDGHQKDIFQGKFHTSQPLKKKSLLNMYRKGSYNMTQRQHSQDRTTNLPVNSSRIGTDFSETNQHYA
ncbi:hypothetical protein CHS0354_016978 [Potamilus streckersoni]|uniref:Thromboxane A2 receptor n=1 Tax=Potamilus streckersoni TaxID=2493646 RepID=A0AAE0RMR6_9BIVA|nr:hypothetical protein CHS0354_016978 [Potamilus streckersoni]